MSLKCYYSATIFLGDWLLTKINNAIAIQTTENNSDCFGMDGKPLPPLKAGTKNPKPQKWQKCLKLVADELWYDGINIKNYVKLESQSKKNGKNDTSEFQVDICPEFAPDIWACN